MTLNTAIRESTNEGRFLSLLVLLTFVIHPVAFALNADTSLSVYVTFAAYLLMLVYAVINRKWLIRRYEIVLICIACVGCIIGAAAGIQTFGDSGFGSVAGYLIGLTAILPFSARLNRADVALLLYVVLLFGLVAALYAFVFQVTQWTNVLRGSQAGSNSWRYFSFFGQRNRFAACLYLSTVCGSSLFVLTKRKTFIIAVIFLVFQIAITNSRTALVAALLSVFACVYFGSKSRLPIVFALGCVSLLAVSLFAEELASHLGAYFSHYGGYDSASARTDMWEFGMRELAEKGMWLFGFGTGTQNIALMPLFGVSSFHNMYIELLFEGGAIKVGTYLILIASSVVVAKSNATFTDARLFRLFYLPLLVSWLVFSVFEAGATPFSTTFFSFVMSVFLIVLPRCCVENAELIEKPSRSLTLLKRTERDSVDARWAVAARASGK